MNANNALVIVAEDEALVRMVATEALVEAGLDVVEAADGDDALAILHSRADQISVLFTDINMPGEMDGLALAHHVRQHWPWIQLVLSSGRPLPALSLLPSGGEFLPKPYCLTDLVTRVTKLLGRA